LRTWLESLIPPGVDRPDPHADVAQFRAPIGNPRKAVRDQDRGQPELDANSPLSKSAVFGLEATQCTRSTEKPCASGASFSTAMLRSGRGLPCASISHARSARVGQREVIGAIVGGAQNAESEDHRDTTWIGPAFRRTQHSPQYRLSARHQDEHAPALDLHSVPLERHPITGLDNVFG
jgi:hypothetical protein